MKHFHYTGSSEQGAAHEGWLMAVSREEAVLQLRDRGIHPYTVRAGPGFIPLKVDEDELLVSLRELASLRRSGMAIDEAVSAVTDTAESGHLRNAWQQVHRMVRAGSSLSDALASVPNAFPGYIVPLVKLGEANGELAEALTIAANRLDEEATLKSEVMSALTYPAFLIVVSVAVVVFMLVAVVPEFSSMVEDSPDEVGGSLRVLLGLSALLVEFAWLWGAAALAAVAGFVYFWRQGSIQARAWSLLRRLPGISSIVESWEVVQFCNSMARLLEGRVGVLEALRYTS